MEFDTYFFVAKTELIEHYKEMLGAKQIGNTQRMYIDGNAFIKPDVVLVCNPKHGK